MDKPLVIINVLDEDTFSDCRITGSINVPLEKLTEYAQTSLDKNTEIIVYCASFSCTASDQAWNILNDLGFHHVFVYPGGAAQWVQLEYPMEGACQKAYLGQQSNDHERNVPTITAQDLRKKMVQKGILAGA